MNNDLTLSYHEASACGASPIGQIVALYDTILRDFVRALVALQAGDTEARVFELNHAIVVIGYLQYVLDHERGGEPAKYFAQLYNLTRAMVVQANCEAMPEPIEELIELFGGVRQAWYQAELESRAGPALAPATDRPGDATAAGDTNPAKDDGGTTQLRWSA